MWLNGVMHGRNPLTLSQLHDNPDDLEYYEYDPQGPSPLESNNVVVVLKIMLDNHEEIRSFVLESLNPFLSEVTWGLRFM